MKRTILLFSFMALIVSTQTAFHFAQLSAPQVDSRMPASSEKLVICQYRSGDIGTVTGKGRTKSEAYKAAAHECFDRRLAYFESHRKDDLDTDHSDALIESCTNITCQ